MTKYLAAILCCLSAIAGILIGIITSGMTCDAVWKDMSVKHGHAEYYLDEDNKRQWRWKDGE